jgi:hypothetical protein
MNPLNKISARGFISIFIVISIFLSIIYSQKAYAEMKEVFGTSTLISNLYAGQIFHDQTNVRFVNNLHMFSSTDADWDKARAFNAYFYINPTRQGDNYNGCFAITHANGDQTFVQYEGSWKWVLPRNGLRWTSESKGRFTGGTGKFEGIRGTWASKGKGDGTKDLGGEWEIEYEISSTNN